MTNEDVHRMGRASYVRNSLVHAPSFGVVDLCPQCVGFAKRGSIIFNEDQAIQITVAALVCLDPLVRCGYSLVIERAA